MAIETAEQFTRRAAVVIPTDAASSARNADLSDLAQILQRQQNAKIDMVAPASALTVQGGNVTVQGLPRSSPTPA